MHQRLKNSTVAATWLTSFLLVWLAIDRSRSTHPANTHVPIACQHPPQTHPCRSAVLRPPRTHPCHNSWSTPNQHAPTQHATVFPLLFSTHTAHASMSPCLASAHPCLHHWPTRTPDHMFPAWNLLSISFLYDRFSLIYYKGKSH